MLLVALFKCAMVISSSTPRPYESPEPEPNRRPGATVRERRFSLDKCRALANNHAAGNHGIYFNQRQEGLFLDLSANVMAVGRAVRVDPGFHISDAEKLVRKHRFSAQSRGPNDPHHAGRCRRGS